MVHDATRRCGCLSAALLLAAAMPTAALAQVTPALVDRHLTVGAGATLAVGAGDLVATLESRVVPDRLVEERGVARRSANVAYRTAKLLLFDLPQEQWLMVANHELFGHGGRVRELFDGYLRFGLDAPAPYGNGGGVTIYTPDDDVTFHELQAVSVGGMEANSVGAALIAARALYDRRLTPRAAIRYLVFELDAFDYIQNTSDSGERDGHDVSDFLDRYNLLADFVEDDRLSARTLRRQSWVSLANPMVASAFVSIGRYLVTGVEDGRVFSLPVGPYAVMPALRYRLTPFGTEVAVDTEVVRGQGAGRLGVRLGRAPFTRPWAVDAFVQGWRVSGWSVGLGTGVWRQPPVGLNDDDFGVAVVGEDLEWGGEVRGRVESPVIRLWQRPTAATLVIEAGFKSSGFVPGEPLDGGLVLRAGLGLPLGRH